MQVNSSTGYQHSDDPDILIIGVTSGMVEPSQVETIAHIGHEPTYFRGYYSNAMEMYADAPTVAAYLDAHQGWFRRCAQPMTAEPLGENGYALIIGRFGSFGYELEPKVGLNLLPQQAGIYRIETIPIPGYHPTGYDVDFQASLQLVESQGDAGQCVTHVEWELHLDVTVYFPRFIHALPQSLVQATGDRLLNEIVRQVSRYLTHKVQVDFHSTHNLPFPRKARRPLFWQRKPESDSPSIPNA